MVWLKADTGLENTYRKLIHTSKADVDWHGSILIKNNTIILPGSTSSLVFDFELKRVYPDIIDIPAIPGDIFEISGRKLMVNIFNILLYVFGKWGAIKGIKVDHSYEKINMLFKQILKDVKAETYYSENGIRFASNGKSVVFEDIIMSAIYKIEAEEKAAEEGIIEGAGEEGIPQGLWHDMKWKQIITTFDRKPLDSKMPGSNRLGSNFYMVPYKCPDCGRNIHMSVYPNRRELLIDTEEGRVYAARVYMCPECSKFYTPRPGKLLSEGDEYILDFDDDIKASEDYKKLIGRKGGKNCNSNFNMYETEYIDKVHNGNRSLAQICSNMKGLSDKDLEGLLEQMDEGFYSENEIKRFMAYIEQELEFRKNGRLNPYTAFRKGLKSGKIGLTGVAGTKKNRVDYSSIEEEEETQQDMAGDGEPESILQKEGEAIQKPGTDSNESQQAAEEATGSTDTRMEDILRKYMAGIEEDRTENISVEEKVNIIEDNYINNTQDKTDDITENNLENDIVAESHEDAAGSKGNNTSYIEETVYNVEEDIQPDKIKSGNKPGGLKSLFNKKKDSKKSADYKGINNIKKETDIINNDTNSISIIRENNNTVDNPDTIPEDFESADNIVTDKEPQLAIYNKETERGIEDNNINNIQDADKKEEKREENILSSEEIVRKISNSKGKKYSDIQKLVSEIRNSNLSNEEKETFIKQLLGMLEQAGKKELDYLISHLPQSDNKERYKRVKERIKTYKDIDTGRYEEIIDKYIQNAEREELSAVVNKARGSGRHSLLKIIEDIKSKDYDLGVLREYSDELYQQVKDIDTETVRKIVPDISALDVEDGIRAMQEIEAADILPEIKTEMTELIDKRLTRMKTEECEQLVEKLRRSLDDRIEDTSRIHYYDARKMLKGDNKDEESILIRKAISKYAVLLGRYEYPVIICDSSFLNNGKEGFIVTPDHIFYKGVIKSGTLDIMDIENISLDSGKTGKAIFASNGLKRKQKLPCQLKGKDQERMADVLNDFVEYLKAKPKSRSVEYMAQEKHTTICCYRCGHVFKAGNICPKCGSRN